ncbi:MAG TPA: DUF3455 domain-containing protein [Steroidobacteraceae bacterium]|nr:DUF3455 domain-containing protein [Steroidobacteraceae bacterium]
MQSWIWAAVGVAAASAQGLPPARMPDSIRAPADEALVLQARGSGVQIYVCQAASDGQARWTLKAPDALLRDGKGAVIIHHYAGPTWKHEDGSTVTGKAVAHADSPDPSSIPWLLVSVTAHSGTGILAHIASVQRLHTKGGQPPAAAGCNGSTLGTEARSAYSADYYFYAPADDTHSQHGQSPASRP